MYDILIPSEQKACLLINSNQSRLQKESSISLLKNTGPTHCLLRVVEIAREGARPGPRAQKANPGVEIAPEKGAGPTCSKTLMKSRSLLEKHPPNSFKQDSKGIETTHQLLKNNPAHFLRGGSPDCSPKGPPRSLRAWHVGSGAAGGSAAGCTRGAQLPRGARARDHAPLLFASWRLRVYSLRVRTLYAGSLCVRLRRSVGEHAKLSKRVFLFILPCQLLDVQRMCAHM